MRELTDQDLQEMREAKAEAQVIRGKVICTKGRARDRRKPGECRSRKDSIASFCSECITSYGLDNGGAGGIGPSIEACTARECHLWPWRGGKLHAEDVLEERSWEKDHD